MAYTGFVYPPTEDADTVAEGTAAVTEDANAVADREASREEADTGAHTGFLWGSLDSYNYTPTQPPSIHPNLSTVHHGDFVSLVTTISQAYQRDRYLDMQALDGIAWAEFGAGQTFHVSKTSLELEVVSPIHSNKPEKVINKVVVKKTKSWAMTERDIRSFNRELRILDHFNGTSNIVRLRGVGWFYNNDSKRPIPHPVLMLEEATSTLRRLVSPSVTLLITSMLEIFYDVTNGLSALHACAVVHGDITIDNVLLFPIHRYHEGVRVRAYTAKLSDFNLAMFDTGGRQYRQGGTRIYSAPEGSDYLTFPELKLTDIYSLGMLFAIVSSKMEDALELDTLHLVVNAVCDSITLTEAIRIQSTTDTEGSTLSRSLVDLVRSLFATTLQVNRWDRDLPRLLESFEACLGRRTRHQVVKPLNDPALTDLTISYGKFIDVSGIVKDQITNGLLRIVSTGAADPRHAKALFELAVIWMSKWCDPRASTADGLQYLWDAAKNGDVRAKALYGRLQQAFGCVSHPEFTICRLDWLASAAAVGIPIALDDLNACSPELARDALKNFASRQIGELFNEKPVNDGELLGSSSGISPTAQQFHTYSPKYQVHWAAGTGSIDVLTWLLEQHPELLNDENSFHDTPLLSACRFGQFETAMLLLKLSAKASGSNLAHENALHFLWRFSSSQAQSLLRRLLDAGADPAEEAAFSYHPDFLDLVPGLSGTPIERSASFNRLDLVRLFIGQGCKIIPSNGNQLRRMLLLAIRLQHTAMQKFLIEYASDQNNEDFRADLRPLHKVGWDYKGKRRTYLDAAILGWVRQTGSGVDMPVDFWHASYHGQTRLDAMKATIDNALHLEIRSDFDEAMLDATLVLAVEEKAYVAFKYIFDLKISHTDGAHARSLSLQKYCWKKRIRDVEPPSRNEIRQDDSILGMPVVAVNYADQIFDQSGTLAQRSVLRGDRALFHILVATFRANLSLPFARAHIDQRQNSESMLVQQVAAKQMNCYSVMALSGHQDLWFAHEFYQLKIDFCFPFGNNPGNELDWEHPLYHALRQRSWAVGLWLIEKGASIFDSVGSSKSVLDQLMTLNPLPPNLLEFLFPLNDKDRNVAWLVPDWMETQGGYAVFCAIAKAIGIWEDTRHHWLPSLKLLSIWLNLLEYYPNVQNQPSPRDQSVLKMTMSLHGSVEDRADRTTSFELLTVPTVRTKVAISSSWNGDLKRLQHRLVISPVGGRWASKVQPVHKLLYSSLMGSPLDAISLGAFLKSRLWKYGYYPSLRQRTLKMISATILIIALVSGILGYIGYFMIWRQDWSQTKRLLIVGLVLGLLWVLICLMVVGALWGLGALVVGVAAAVHAFVVLVLGPSMIPAEFFDVTGAYLFSW